MFVLKVSLKKPLLPEAWDCILGKCYLFDSFLGVQEEEVPAPSDLTALHNANEFAEAIDPGILNPPKFFEVFFNKKNEAESCAQQIHPFLKNITSVLVEEIEDKDYSENWKATFHPMHVDPDWFIRSTWHEPEATHKKLELILDPGMAFGTGSHETTQSCLQLISKAISQFPIHERVLDFGCGSGILSIALKKKQIKVVEAVDIDPLALEATLKNAELNSVKIDLIADKINESEKKSYDGIVANILKSTLIEFSEKFHSWLRPQGFLILSGILSEQKDEIKSHFLSSGFALIEELQKKEWVSLLLYKK
jgi:ribosomal protein L11 methyltransferase